MKTVKNILMSVFFLIILAGGGTCVYFIVREVRTPSQTETTQATQRTHPIKETTTKEPETSTTLTKEELLAMLVSDDETSVPETTANIIETVPETTVTPEPETTVTIEPETTVTPEPETTVTIEPETTVTPEPETTVTPEPETLPVVEPQTEAETSTGKQKETTTAAERQTLKGSKYTREEYESMLAEFEEKNGIYRGPIEVDTDYAANFGKSDFGDLPDLDWNWGY